MSELIWKKIENELPKETGAYFVRQKIQDTPIVATFVNLTDKWSLRINGNYWDINGVYEWAEIPRRKKKSWPS